MGLLGLTALETKKMAAWTRCRPIYNQPSDFARVDDHGYIIRWADYGTQGDYGWEIDHIHPTGLGGSDDLSNFRALHWRVNRSLGGLLGNQLSALQQVLGKRANPLKG